MTHGKLATIWRRLRQWRLRRAASQIPAALADLAPLDLRLVGRTIFHTALVGLAAGFIGAGFFWVLENLSFLLLEQLAGYRPLRAHGEQLAIGADHAVGVFRPWLLILLPAVGGLLTGLVARSVPEVSGSGADGTIAAFHQGGGLIRRRVIWAKPLASMATLGTGGAGGREGPTMLIGAAIGTAIGQALRLGSRERRLLLVAGIAAGISAVFRTPLGAALVAVEVLYRDDFEAVALVPAILASVVAYSVVISIFGESVLLAHAPRYPFTPSHLPLYGLLAVFIAVLAHLSLTMLDSAGKLFARFPGPVWLRPAWGGLCLGVLVTPLIVLSEDWTGTSGQGLGLLGGGYGAAQAAITGAPWLTPGWTTVGILVLLAFGKLVTSALTVSSGGSAGTFAPSLAIGGLFGGAFGGAAQLLFDPAIDPGAFALVGMGAFYGGIAHVPLSALIMVCELAGSYDLLVPLMLALGISMVAMRKRTLYPSQVPSQRDSAAHREEALVSALEATRVRDVMKVVPDYARFTLHTTASEMMRQMAAHRWQDTFPVLLEDGQLLGLVKADTLRLLASDPDASLRTARDVLMPPVVARLDDTLRTVGERLVRDGLRELPVVDEHDRIAGFIDAEQVTKRYLGTLTQVAGPRRSHTTQFSVLPPHISHLDTRPRPVSLPPRPPLPPLPEPTSTPASGPPSRDDDAR